MVNTRGVELPLVLGWRFSSSVQVRMTRPGRIILNAGGIHGNRAITLLPRGILRGERRKLRGTRSEAGPERNGSGLDALLPGPLLRGRAIGGRSGRDPRKGPGRAVADLAEALDALAIILHARGRFSESEAVRQRSIAIFERTRGQEHPDLAASLNSLAALYISIGRYSKAEPSCAGRCRFGEKPWAPKAASLPWGSSTSRRSSRHSDDVPSPNRCTGEPLTFAKKSLAPTTLTLR